MKWCRKCGTQMEDNQKYCPECGTRQEDNAAESNQNYTADRPAEKRKKSGMLPALMILFIGIGVIAAMIFVQKQKPVKSEYRGDRESAVSAEAGNLSAQSRETEETSAAYGSKEGSETAASTEEKETSAQSGEIAHEEKNTESKEKETEPDRKDESADTDEKAVDGNEKNSSSNADNLSENKKNASEDEFILKYSREFSCMDADVDALITVTPVSEKEVRIDIVLPDSYEFEYYGEIIDETSVDFTLDAGEKIHMVWSDEYYFEVYPDDGFEEESVQMVGRLCTALNYQGYTINAG